MLTGSGRKGSKSNKIIIWAVPVGVVFFLLLAALGYFVVKSRRLHRSFYRLVRNDDFDQGITYHNTGKEILFRVEIILWMAMRVHPNVKCYFTGLKFLTISIFSVHANGPSKIDD